MHTSKKNPPFCPYCKQDAKLVTGAEIYPHRPDLSGRFFWLCKPCDAYVGTHEGSKGHQPLGRLANKELRLLKQQAHSCFDPLWRNRGMRRKEAYQILADVMGLELKKTHIGYFNEEQCKQVIKVFSEGTYR